MGQFGQPTEVMGQYSMGAPDAQLNDIISNMLAQSQPRSGAVGLPQQQAQQLAMTIPPGQSYPSAGGSGLLPPPLGGDAQTDPMGLMGNGPLIDLPPLPGMGGAPPAPAPTGIDQGGAEALPIQGQTQRQPMGAQGGQGQQPQGAPDWANMLNLTGTGTNPNAFTRMGVGYNAGGLMGALGYLLTDLSEQNNRPQGGGY
jgi:hypothetical protein